MSAYTVTAQFYDALASDAHAPVDLEIARALQGLRTAGHPVLDIGAGTGLTTRVIAAALPDAGILAVEPDPAMRSALMTRVWSDEDLRRRVSILPQPVLSAPLPSVISAAVAGASLVHFDPRQRQELWALLSDRLSPAGRVVVEIQCPLAQDLAETCFATAQVGRITYEGWAAAERLDDAQQRWRLRYVARLDGTEIDCQDTAYVCWTISSDQVLEEAGGFGFTGSASGSLVILQVA